MADLPSWRIATEIAARDFGKAVVCRLRKRGITFIGATIIPGPGPMPFANGDRGYEVADNGTGRVWTYAQVRAAAQEAK